MMNMFMLIDMFVRCLAILLQVQTDAQQIGPTQFVFNLTDVESIHHVVVFLTGVTPFPDGMGGGVYYCYPTPDGPKSQLLGFIANSKPSAIFKLAKVCDGVHEMGCIKYNLRQWGFFNFWEKHSLLSWQHHRHIFTKRRVLSPRHLHFDKVAQKKFLSNSVQSMLPFSVSGETVGHKSSLTPL